MGALGAVAMGALGAVAMGALGAVMGILALALFGLAGRPDFFTKNWQAGWLNGFCWQSVSFCQFLQSWHMGVLIVWHSFTFWFWFSIVSTWVFYPSS